MTAEIMLLKRAAGCYTALAIIWQGQKQSVEENTDDNDLKKRAFGCTAVVFSCNPPLCKGSWENFMILRGNIHRRSTPAI